MSNELLADVAFAAINGDKEEALGVFMQYCEDNDIALEDYSVDLEKVAKAAIGACAGKLNVNSSIDTIASQFGLEATFEAKNEDKTIEEERAESYNESVAQ